MLPPASRILMIRPSALGDVARSVPVLASLKLNYPDAQIDWLVQDGYVDAIRHHPALHRAVPFPRKQFSRVFTNPAAMRAFLRWARDLRRGNYDMVVDLQGLLRSGIFSRLTGARTRLGPSDARELGWLGYTHRINPGTSLHTVDRMLGILSGAGLKTVADMTLYVGADENAWAMQWLDEQHITPEQYAVFAPTSQWLCKCWPVERFREIGKKLLDSGRLGKKIIVLAAPSEATQIKPLLENWPSASPVIWPRTTIGQMMALIRHSGLVLCNDSSSLHMAVGFKRPIVTMFGPTDPRRAGPYGREECLVVPPSGAATDTKYRHHGNDQTMISQITIDAVWSKVREQLHMS